MWSFRQPPWVFPISKTRENTVKISKTWLKHAATFVPVRNHTNSGNRRRSDLSPICDPPVLLNPSITFFAAALCALWMWLLNYRSFTVPAWYRAQWQPKTFQLETRPDISKMIWLFNFLGTRGGFNSQANIYNLSNNFFFFFSFLSAGHFTGL